MKTQLFGANIFAAAFLLVGYNASVYSCPSGQYSFTVNANPLESQIRVMNISPKYFPGICLKQGWYDIKVTHPNH